MTHTLGPSLALALALPLAACDDSTAPVPEEPGAVSVLLTGDPSGQFAEAWLEIRSIYLQSTDDFTDPPESRHYLLRDGASGFELQHAEEFTLTSAAEAEPGLYRSVHLVFSEACVLSGDGRPFTSSDRFPPCGREDPGVLRLSDGDSASAQVRIGFFEIASGETQTVRLELDIGESFARTESGWLFDPLLTQEP